MPMIVVVENIDCEKDRCGKCWYLLKPDSMDPQNWCHQFQCHTDGKRLAKCHEAEETAKGLAKAMGRTPQP